MQSKSPPKSLKVTFTLKAATLEEAIADLANRFLRPGKTGVRVGTQPTEFPVLELCKRLVDDWRGGKVVYQPSSITLVFSSGDIDTEADLLICKPEQGDRFLYYRHAPRSAQLHLPFEDEAMRELARQIGTLNETLTQLTEHQRAVERRLQVLEGIGPSEAPGAGGLGAAPTGAGISMRQLRELLEAQAAHFAQLVAKQLASTALPLSQRLDQVQAQLELISSQLAIEEAAAPQTEADWLRYLQAAWGTVGDYEQYSTSHREANAETPLFDAPDWVALCELDWARQLHPTIALLHTLIHGEDGIGEAGADVLQQFGRHIDGRTGDRYYIYKLGGFSAYDALWQLVSDPRSAWLTTLQRLSKKSARFYEVFQLFGWEAEAIAALDSVVERALREKQAGRQSGYTPPPGSRAGSRISDYLAVLNIGPFTPITPESIKRAYKQAMKTAHPDTGGSKEKAQQVNEAYEAIVRHYALRE